MKTTFTAQQASFFTKNGFIEFEIPYTLPPVQTTRDLWRGDAKLRDFLIRKLGPLALALTGKNQLRLACDQWISKENRPEKPCALKEMFSIQGFALATAFAENAVLPPRRSPLGILPLPSPGHILFFRPDLLLDWPHVSSDVYLALYALPNAVYFHNPKDPATNFLKRFGYNFGDVLKNSEHPLIF